MGVEGRWSDGLELSMGNGTRSSFSYNFRVMSRVTSHVHVQNLLWEAQMAKYKCHFNFYM